MPSEETVVEIRERYLELNWHAKSYTWKALVKAKKGRPLVDGAEGQGAADAAMAGEFIFAELDLNKTLEENGVPNETSEFEDHQVRLSQGSCT